MFCPNCGRNCGTDRFCSSCGTKLQQQEKEATQPTRWEAGMPCPHCGGTKLEGNNCLFCGAQLLADMPAETEEVMEWEDSYDFPYRGFYHRGFTLKLERDGIAVERHGMFSKERIYIPFTQLKEAEYAYYSSTNSRMLFVSEDGSRTAFLIREDEKGLRFSNIFYLIKYLAAPHTRFVINIPSMDTGRIRQLGVNVNLRDYFDRFNPLWDQAAIALSCDCHILLEEAEQIIESAFYAYQKELYEAEPIFAVRDYNRIQAEIHRKYEKKDKDTAESDLRRRRRNRRR